jgi:hypothetical protein
MTIHTAREALAEAGYSDQAITEGLAYADQHSWADEDERGAYALARILYSDTQLADSPKAPWEPCLS